MPKSELLTPKFLTAKIAEEAVGHVLDTIYKTGVTRFLNREQMCHVVVLVPAMERPLFAEAGTKWTNYVTQPHFLYHHSVGRTRWPYRFDDIASSKALQLWHDRNDGQADIMPHLLFSGDAPFWGGVKRSGIVVTCSGVQPYFDRMIAGMAADMCIGLAYHAWMESDDKKDDERCFLT